MNKTRRLPQTPCVKRKYPNLRRTRKGRPRAGNGESSARCDTASTKRSRAHRRAVAMVKEQLPLGLLDIEAKIAVSKLIVYRGLTQIHECQRAPSAGCAWTSFSEICNSVSERRDRVNAAHDRQLRSFRVEGTHREFRML